MMTALQAIWNLILGILLLIEAIRFDYHHVRRLKGKVFRWTGEKWHLSEAERLALNRFLLWLVLGLTGNAVLLALRLIL